MRIIFYVLWIAMFASSSNADSVTEQDRHYQAAKRDWLSGKDDLRTLKELAALANEDNLRAQILLGMISREPQTHLHLTQELGGDVYREIFRQPNRRFGRPWLFVAAPSSQLATLLTAQGVEDVEDFESHAMALAEAGLITSAIRYAYVPMKAGSQIGTVRALSHPNLLPYTKPSLVSLLERSVAGLLISNKLQEASEMMALRMKLPAIEFQDRLLMSDLGDLIPFRDFPYSNDAFRLRGQALLHHPDLEPLANILRDICPQDTGYHMGVLYNLSFSLSLRQFLISPFEPVISTAEWQNSARFRGDVLRNWHPNTSRFEILKNVSSCLAKAITDLS